MRNGPTKIILINSGKYEYAEVGLDGAIQIVGPNNGGKTTLISTLQFLYIDELSKMAFRGHTLDETFDYFLHSEHSYVLFECRTVRGLVVIGWRGAARASGADAQRFFYLGPFRREDFLHEDRLRPPKEISAQLADRDFQLVTKAAEHRALLLSGVSQRNSGLGIVALKEGERFSDFRDTLKNLLNLANISQDQMRERLLMLADKNAVVQIYRYVSEGSFDAYMWQTLETKAKFIAQVMTGDMTIRRVEDLDSAALTYAEVKAIASGNPLVIEKAQVDAELMRLTRLRSAHAEEQYRIRANVRRSHEDAETFTARLANLRQDITMRLDTSGDNFHIELDGQPLDNRGIAGELIVRRAEKMKNRFGEDVRMGRFAGFDLFLRPSINDTVEVVLRGKNSYTARVTDTALGTIRSVETTVQGFEERAAKLETDIADSQKRAKELESKVGALFDREERYQELSRRQGEIEEKLDLTKNQASNQLDGNEDTQTNATTETADDCTTKKIERRSKHGIRV